MQKVSTSSIPLKHQLHQKKLKKKITDKCNNKPQKIQKKKREKTYRVLACWISASSTLRESLKDFLTDPIYISLLQNLQDQAIGSSLWIKTLKIFLVFSSPKPCFFSFFGGGVGSSQRSFFFFYSVLESEAIDREGTRGLESGMSWS